jgi:hypothetical protein
VQRRIAPTRAVLRCLAVLVVTAALIAVTPGTAIGAVTPAAGPPTAGGVVQPVIDLAAQGLVVSEVFLEGSADSYHGTLPSNAPWTVEPDGAPKPYTTRMQIVKPARGPLSGTVYVEWLHPSGDNIPVWGETYAEIKNQGAVFVGISASKNGVDFIKNADPGRYGSLDHPGDSYAFDIFTQGGQALLDDPATIVGPGFDPEVLIAVGHSATGSRLITYVNAFGDDSPYDAFYPSGTTGGIALRSTADTGLPPVPVPSPTFITNTEKPVIRHQAESENGLARQDDSPTFRWWEVPGTSHVVPPYPMSGDNGRTPHGARQLFEWLLNPIDQAPLAPPCDVALNAGPGAWVRHAALRSLDAWVRDGTPAPVAPRLLTTDGLPPSGNPPPNDNLVRDVHGNAMGGIRTPHVDVPVATLLGEVANPNPAFCSAFGGTIAFTPEKLATLYPNHGDFLKKWKSATDSTVAAGFFTPEDGRHIAASPSSSDIGK